MINKWVDEGREWGHPIRHEDFVKAREQDEWHVLLTPTKPVPREWFCDLRGAKILGPASGRRQQMPIFAARGTKCTVMDFSERQLDREREVAEREN